MTMPRSVRLVTAINGAFLTRRWEEPENWMRLTRECGFPAHSFCSDLLDPFFSGDRAYQLDTAARTREAAERHGVTICDIYTGVATHRFHGLSHSHPAPRARMVRWIEKCMDIANAMGVTRIGGHWDAFSCEVLADPTRTREATERVYETFREIRAMAERKGMRAVFNEQMYIPSEIPWTLEGAEEFLLATNRGGAGVPVRVAIDVGHQAGMHYGLAGADLDYREWLRRFGAFTELVHVQQTTADASHHWPFTPEFNARGQVDLAAVIDAIEQSHRAAAESPLAAVLEPADVCYLVAELIPGSTKTEDRVLAELTETARFLNGYLPGGDRTLLIP